MRLVLLTGSLVITLSACFIAPTSASTPLAGGLHAGDKLHVLVYDHAELSVDTTVSNSGQIIVPLVGSVAAAGRLPQDVAQSIEVGLRRYVVSPSVDVSVLEQNTTAYYGGIMTGAIALRPGETLAMAASDPKIPANADLTRVALIRMGANVGSYDVLTLQAAGQPGPLLQPNDVVAFVTNPVVVTVSGAVDAPVTAYLRAGEPLGDALAQAKLAKDANLQRIAVIQGATTVVAGRESATFAQPGQTGWAIVIPHAAQVTMLGFVGKAGPVTLPGDQSLESAITAAGGVKKGGDLANVIVLGPNGASKGIYDVTKFARGDIAANPTLEDGDVAYVPEQPKIPFYKNPKVLLITALYVAKTYLHLEIPPKP